VNHDHLPPAKRPVRTHSSARDAWRNHCDYACPVEIHRPRAQLVDTVCWFAAGLLVSAVLCSVYFPGVIDPLGLLASR
jgi:hypothetical protein